MAQQGGGGQGRRGGMQFGGGGNASPSSLLIGFGGGGRRGGGGGGGQNGLRDDVISDLKLTDAQKKTFDDYRTAQGEKIREMFQGGSRPDADAMKKMMADAQTDANKVVADTLTPAQVTRLGQIFIQTQGARAITHADTQKALAITADQKTKIESIVSGEQKANQAIGEQMQDGSLDRDAAREKMTSNRKVGDDALMAVLTADQKTKLTEMGGPKFVRSSE